MADVRPALETSRRLVAPSVALTFYAIVLLLRLTACLSTKSNTLIVITASPAIAVVAWAPPAIGFVAALALAGWWWVSSE